MAWSFAGKTTVDIDPGTMQRLKHSVINNILSKMGIGRKNDEGNKLIQSAQSRVLGESQTYIVLEMGSLEVDSTCSLLPSLVTEIVI